MTNLTLEDKYRIEKDLAAKAEEDLFTFLAVMWNQLGGKGQFKRTWHTEAICDHLQALYYKSITRLLISISPRKGKSLSCSVGFPVWAWINDPTAQFISASYGSELATRDAVRSRDAILSPFYQKYWGDRFRLSSDQNQKTRYSNNKGGYRISTSVGGKGTGEGCDYLIIDDPHKAEEANSPALLQKTVTWYFDTMSSRWNNASTWCNLIIHQRVAVKDLIGTILEREGEDWCVLKLPEEYIPTTYITPIGWSDPRKEKGELLAPELLNAKQVIKEKGKGKFRWWSQFQQEPGVEEGNYIKDTDLRYYDYTPDKKYIQYAVLSIDASGGSITDTASYAVTQLWINISGAKKNEWRLHQMFRKRCSFTEHMQDIKRNFIDQYKLDYILLENKANGKAIYDTLQTYDVNHVKYFTDKYKEENIVLINPNDYGDKEQRYIAAVKDFDNEPDTFILLPNPNKYEWGVTVKEEMLQFPRYGSDDIVDAYSQFSIWLRKNKKTLYKKQKKDVIGLKDYRELESYLKMQQNVVEKEVFTLFDNNISETLDYFR